MPWLGKAVRCGRWRIPLRRYLCVIRESFCWPASPVKVVHSHLVVTYTTKVVNPSGNRLATPDIVIVPTVSQVLAGTDPVLGPALSYRVPS